jgi:hypothetical protein
VTARVVTLEENNDLARLRVATHLAPLAPMRLSIPSTSSRSRARSPLAKRTASISESPFLMLQRISTCRSDVQPVTTLGILLSPDGKVPSGDCFVRLYSFEFADAMREAIEVNTDAPDETRLLVTAFFVSYKWFS